MNDTLLIYARICPTDSLHTKPIYEALSKLGNIDCLKLDGSKPYDIAFEQERIKKYKNVILLYTINWFNLPWNLVRYMAEVWRTFPFNLEGINFYKVITTGGNEESYSPESRFGWSVEQYMNNINSCITKLGGNVKDSFIYYDCVNFNQSKLDEFITKLTTFFKNM